MTMSNQGVAQNQSNPSRSFDYHAALMRVSDDPFALLADHAYPLIEWCLGDALVANREGATGRLSKRLEFLSVMAGYFGASPIAKLSHHIDLAMSEKDQRWIEQELT